MHIFLSLISISLSALVHGYVNPGICSGACNVHDPGLIQRESDGVYFRFSTGNNISYASSSSIEGPWEVLGPMLPNGSSIDLDGRDDLWAPDVQLINGVYHVYYSVSVFGSQNSAIGLATSDTMDAGTWTEHGATGIRSDSSKSYNAIDANLFNDGVFYLNFGSFWTDIYQVEMDSTAMKVSSSAYNIVYDPNGDHAVEGAFLYK
ncbi:hypothetical protein EYZ11_005312 [Aspergillus tanneri]|uniref:Endo-1,5-alpha-L-arabinanase A n=1 Tax=Aspergillus tanneri TaxID=1220188 RepID=A0A4S3JI69_9EURO|nr:uncharacterized protein ATNIH1004_003800 [Aspergillus tanneri]KAA8651107.1 hypothetical protein ATNIH1004_003800 [Aspergillus tanneri]THC95196.1 hypothetical protein EYZ11_005312 [Aspergillus tanneri]